MLQKKRNLSIDVVKIVAMFGVIMLHTTHDFMSASGWDVASFLYKSSVVSIPLFFTVSGYLLLGREDISYRYVFNKILSIGRYVVIFCLIYWIFRGLTAEWIPIYRIIKNSLLGQGQLFAFWYFSALCLVYLFLPLINRLFRNNLKIFIWCWLLCFLIQNLIFTYNVLTGTPEINAVFRLYNWIGYFMLGGVLKSRKFHRCPIFLITIAFCLNFIFQTIIVYKIHTNYCSFFYSSAIVILLVSIVFNYISQSDFSHNPWAIRELSKLFLIVFSIHPLFLEPVYKVLGGVELSSYLSLFAIVNFSVVSILSVGTGYLIMQLPYANKIFRI